MFQTEKNNQESSSAFRRGWLRHGNPPGDLAAVRRCGARTRAGGCCSQPAMKNGRCRFHGGKSTGPRTPEGLARSRAARYVHGHRSAEMIALRHEAALHSRMTAILVALVRRRLAEEKHGNRAMNPMSGERQPGSSLGGSPSEPDKKPRKRAMNPMSGEPSLGDLDRILANTFR